jgi:drug/metabolite transporter (DMT)-like permease
MIRHPFARLLMVGGLLATVLLAVRAAVDAGLSPLGAALASTVGAGGVLLLRVRSSGAGVPVRPGELAFYVVAGGFSYALPNLLVFGAAGRIGAGYAALLHAFVPALTYALALLVRQDAWSSRRGGGLLLALAGAATVVLGRFAVAMPIETGWIVLAAAAPVSIAIGNVLRSRFWPFGARPDAVAAALLLAAGVQLAVFGAATGFATPRLSATQLPWAVTLAGLSAVYYALYFRLQQQAGPVYLSQIGYVAAGFGVPLGALLFAERLTPAVLIGAALDVAGVLLVRPGDASKTSAGLRPSHSRRSGSRP